MFESIREWFTSGAWLPALSRVGVAVVIAAGAILLARAMGAWLEAIRRRARNSDASRIIYVVEKVGGYGIIVVGLLMALSTLGLNLESLNLFAGALGVGAGLGLQGIVREFFSGLVLIFNPQVRVGDFVELEDGLRGEIVEIGTRATRLRTNDHVSIVIPNSTMVQSRLTNWTYSETPRRLHIPFSVVESADKAKVRDVVLEAARDLPFTLPDTDRRRTQVWLKDFAHDGLDFELIVWPDEKSCRHPSSMHAAYTWAIHDALTKAGIDNAAPQLEVRLQSVFGRHGEMALRAMGVSEDRIQQVAREPDAARTKGTPNDAVQAVFDDAERNAIMHEVEEAAPRRRSTGAEKAQAALKDQ